MEVVGGDDVARGGRGAPDGVAGRASDGDAAECVAQVVGPALVGAHVVALYQVGVRLAEEDAIVAVGGDDVARGRRDAVYLDTGPEAVYDEPPDHAAGGVGGNVQPARIRHFGPVQLDLQDRVVAHLQGIGGGVGLAVAVYGHRPVYRRQSGGRGDGGDPAGRDVEVDGVC